MTTFALIPARSGSKGIPRKNIRRMAGKPLIAWTIEAALRAPGIDAVVVSTEDAEIAEIARRAGAEVPFMRPAELATDSAAGIEPVLHAIGQLPQHDAVLLLQPTSPLRDADDIAGILEKARTSAAPAVVSMCEAESHPAWMYRLDQAGRLAPVAEMPSITRRQELPPVWMLNGAMYFARTAWLVAHRTFVAPDTIGYVMPRDRSVDIDDELDWRLAELLLEARLGSSH